MKHENYLVLQGYENIGIGVCSHVKENRAAPRINSSDMHIISAICKDEIGQDLPRCMSCLSRKKEIFKQLSEKFYKYKESLEKKYTDENSDKITDENSDEKEKKKPGRKKKTI